MMDGVIFLMNQFGILLYILPIIISICGAFETYQMIMIILLVILILEFILAKNQKTETFRTFARNFIISGLVIPCILS